MIETKFYVYEWFIVETGEIFYVGKGTGNRVTSMKDRNAYFKNIRTKYKCDYRILRYFDNEEDAYNFELERGLELKKSGQARACYVLGNYQRYISPETLKKMKPTQFKKKAIPWNKGVKMNDEFRQKCRERTLGTTQSDETKHKRSQALMNHTVSESARNRIAKARMKVISVKNLETGELKIYENIQSLAKELGVTQSALCRPLRTGKTYRNKYILNYANTEVNNQIAKG